MSTAVWLPIAISALSVAIAGAGVLLRRPLDRQQLAEMKQRQIDADKQRTREDDERHRDRVEADERRSTRLHQELEELSGLSNERFRQWQESVRDLDDLWVYLEDRMLPYQRRAYNEIKRLDPNSAFGPPPALPHRNRHRGNDNASGDDSPGDDG